MSTMPNPHPIRRRASAAGLALLLTAFGSLTACGDDDETSTASTTTARDEGGGGSGGGDLEAACATDVELQATFNEIPFPEGDEPTAEETDAITSFFADEIEPLLADLEGDAPDDAPIDRTIELMRTIGETGDLSAVESPEGSEVFNEYNAYFFESCGDQTVDVTALEYKFSGVSETVDAGLTRFKLTNSGKELHEMVLFKKGDTDLSFEEIFELDDDEAEGLVEEAGGTFAVQGQSGYAASELSPGEYVMICFVPTGMTDPTSEPAEDAPPHFAQGMIQPFTVA